MLEKLKEEVCSANKQLPKLGLVMHTWGNVSGIDREQGLIVIKPSGVAYEELKPEDFSVLRLSDGKQLEGLSPSSDTPTHLVLYRSFPQLGGIVHTHSTYAVAWAQAGKPISCLGTTHADYFYGSVPCTRFLTAEETAAAYEAATGNLIVETFAQQKLNPMDVPAVLCRGHGPFAWGRDAAQAVYHAAVLEEVAKMALLTAQIVPSLNPLPDFLLEKHYQRKHGPDAYYGQKKR